MSNVELNRQTAAELGQFRLNQLRIGLRALVRAHSAEDIVIVLREAFDDQAMVSGDFDKASEMRLACEFLHKFEKFVDNYDPTRE